MSRWVCFFSVLMAAALVPVAASAQGTGCTVGYSVVPCKSVAMRTLTVAQDGSGDYRTISAAVAQVQPGDTVLVKNGRYNEFFSVDRSGTADMPITIKAAPGAHPVIFAGAQKDNEISLRGDWIVFDGFEIEKSWGGITVYGAHIIVRSSYIHDNGQLSDPNTVFNGQGMLVVSTHDVLLDNNRFERNGIYHRDNFHMHGVYLTDFYHRGMSNITFTRNYFEGHGGAGIQVWISKKVGAHGNHHLMIDGNTFKNNDVELICTFVEDAMVRNNTFIHNSHPRSSAKPDGFSAVMWFEFSRDITVENNTFEAQLNGPNDYIVFEKNRGDTQTYRGNTWKVPANAKFKRNGTDYSDFASMFHRVAGSNDKIQLTTAAVAGTTPIPAAERASAPAVLPSSDLQQFVGLFGSRKPFAQVRVFVDQGSLKATMLHERGRPSYLLRPLSSNRFHIEGTPPGFDLAFDGRNRLTVYRPGAGNVSLSRER